MVAQARAAGVALHGLGELRVVAGGPPGLVLGYAHLPEPAITRAVAALGEAAERAAGLAVPARIL